MSFVEQANLSIRKATEADAGDFAFILCESWKGAYKDILTADELAKNTDLKQRKPCLSKMDMIIRVCLEKKILFEQISLALDPEKTIVTFGIETNVAIAKIIIIIAEAELSNTKNYLTRF